MKFKNSPSVRKIIKISFFIFLTLFLVSRLVTYILHNQSHKRAMGIIKEQCTIFETSDGAQKAIYTNEDIGFSFEYLSDTVLCENSDSYDSGGGLDLTVWDKESFYSGKPSIPLVNIIISNSQNFLGFINLPQRKLISEDFIEIQGEKISKKRYQNGSCSLFLRCIRYTNYQFEYGGYDFDISGNGDELDIMMESFAFL